MKRTFLCALCLALVLPATAIAARNPVAKLWATVTSRTRLKAAPPAVAQPASITPTPTRRLRTLQKPARVRVPTPTPTLGKPTAVPTATLRPTPRPSPTATRVPTSRPTPLPTLLPTATPAPTATPTPLPQPTATPPIATPTPRNAPPPSVTLSGLTPVNDSSWDDTAVRKVLNTFAYGGQPSDDQIQRWADMSPSAAIVEMLRWDEHNLQLSQPSAVDNDNLPQVSNSLSALSAWWSSNNPGNRMPEDRRADFNNSAWGRPTVTLLQALLSRGLNPFRERIGFWETNYHMSIPLGSAFPGQLIRYYDSIMQAHAEGQAYQDVMLTAALSPAVARHYGHIDNIWVNNQCYCNEDFGREFHQLFFGVLGTGDRDYHEYVTIKNTAKALTDMQLVNRANPAVSWEGEDITFGTAKHYPYPVEVLHTSYAGATAAEQINAIGQAEIEHPESLDNLPLMIVRGLADDEIDANEAAALQTAWRSMPRKDLLSFLRAYATSTLFHSPNRVHYQTSFDRFLTFANHDLLSNEEAYIDLQQFWAMTWLEQERPFNPDHAVFGGQTGTEARDNAGIFRSNFNYMAGSYLVYLTDGLQHGRNFKKDWASVAPHEPAGAYRVAAVAEWLWQRFVADGLKNFGPLERAHVAALLATGWDASVLAHPNNPDQPITLAETETPTLQSQLATWNASTIQLSSSDATERRNANIRVNQAIAFIAATPFIYVQEGR